MTNKHKIDLGGTRIDKMVREILADRMAEVILHHRDPYVVKGKPSKITINVTMTPINNGLEFTETLSSGLNLAPRETFKTHVFSGVDKDGQAVISDYDLEQLDLPFERKEE